MTSDRFYMLDSDGESDILYDYQHIKYNEDDDLCIVDVYKDGEHWYTEELEEDVFYDIKCNYLVACLDNKSELMTETITKRVVYK